jgi:nicotinamidase-related amidase
MTTGLLIIDFQNDYYPSFDGAKMPLSGTELASQNAAKLVEAFRASNSPIFHVRHEFPTQDAPFFAPNTTGSEIHPSVAPISNEVVVVKNQINSFRDTNLAEQLAAKGVKRLVIVGAMSHMCIDAGVRAATDLGFECLLAHDACATLDLEFNGVVVPAEHVHSAFMAALSFGYCNVDSTDNLLSILKA